MHAYRTPPTATVNSRNGLVHTTLVAATVIVVVTAPMSLAAPPAGTIRTASFTRTQDGTLRERLIGTWKTSKFGEQVITHGADGKAVMEMKLNRLAAMLYGKTMTLNMEWSVEGGMVKHHIVSGTPENKVAKLIRDFGDTYSYRVVDVDATEAVLEETDEPEKQTRWELVSAR
jgi:hypothetical protein